jgi:hypothetical protein
LVPHSKEELESSCWERIKIVEVWRNALGTVITL